MARPSEGSSRGGALLWFPTLGRGQGWPVWCPCAGEAPGGLIGAAWRGAVGMGDGEGVGGLGT